MRAAVHSSSMLFDMLELSRAVSSREYHTQIKLRTRLEIPHSDYPLR